MNLAFGQVEDAVKDAFKNGILFCFAFSDDRFQGSCQNEKEDEELDDELEQVKKAKHFAIRVGFWSFFCF